MIPARKALATAFLCFWYVVTSSSQETEEIYRIMNDDGEPIAASDWEVSMAALVAKLEKSPASSFVFLDLLPLFFPTGRQDIFQQLSDQSTRLVNISSPEFSTIVQDDANVLLAKLLHYRLNSTNDLSATDEVREMTLDFALTYSEHIFAKLSNNPQATHTFVLSVPLAFFHLSALKEKLTRSSVNTREKTENDIFIWISKYWQFVHDRYNTWNQWRMQQLQMEHWLITTATASICHASLFDKLSKGYLIKLETGRCDDPQPFLEKVTSVFSAYSNRLQFEMVEIVSKLSVLDKFIPGYRRAEPFPGIFSVALTSGIIHPLGLKDLTSNMSYLGPEPKCQPVLTNTRLRGITKITVHQWDRLDGMQVQYENGDDRFHGSQNGTTSESISFVPSSDQCLASIRWKMSSMKNITTSATFTSRDGRSRGARDRRKWADITAFTTAPLLYCISSIAVCAVHSEGPYSRPAVVAVKVYFELSNAASTIPQPMEKSLEISQSPVAVLNKQNYVASSGTKMQSVPVAATFSSAKRTTSGPAVTGTEFRIPDVIIIVAASVEERDDILQSQIKPLWEKILDGRVSSTINISLDIDNRFTPRFTHDGRELRAISYRVCGSVNGDLDKHEETNRFGHLAATAKLPYIWAVFYGYGFNFGNLVFIHGNNRTSTPPAVIRDSQNITTTSPIIPPGPFVINNVLAEWSLAELGNRSIYDTLDEDLLPLWASALGANVTHLKLVFRKGRMSTWENGTFAEQMTYRVNGETNASLDMDVVFRQFAAKAGEDTLKNARAVSEHYGI